jgi:AraC-like DNA-binding protein
MVGMRTNGDWSEYWRSPDHPLEAMRAHFERHVYARHSHEAYSFGVTESGAQAFTCRGAARTSTEGMVMAFNPDEPHDGRAAEASGFTYRIVHLAPDLVADVLADTMEHPVGLPLFAEPVIHDPVLADALLRLHAALPAHGEPVTELSFSSFRAAAVSSPEWSASGTQGKAPRKAARKDRARSAPMSLLAQDEALADTVRAMVRRAAVHAPPQREPRLPDGIRRVRDVLHDTYWANPSSAELAVVAGCSRFALHRAFRTEFGLAPSDYQRQVRLRAARRLLAAGRAPADVAVETGFADQSHLTRWFVRCYGIGPAAFQNAVTERR